MGQLGSGHATAGPCHGFAVDISALHCRVASGVKDTDGYTEHPASGVPEGGRAIISCCAQDAFAANSVAGRDAFRLQIL